MKRTQRTQLRKSRSGWWDSHISPENSKWLSENLQEMETQVKEMLGLIEEEGESSAEKAEVYYQDQPMLVSHVKNFYRMYHALAERYDNVTRELRKSIPSSLQSHGSSAISESDSEIQSLPSSTEPDMQDKVAQQKPKNRSDCFDVSIGSSVSSDVSKKGSDGSSSSSESDSELDEAKEENGNSIIYALSQRIIELEDELNEARGKLDSLEENMPCQSNFGTNSEESEHDEKLQVSDLESKNNLEKDIEEVNSEKEALEAVLLANKNETDELKEAMASAAKQFEIELAHRDLEVEKCKQELGVFLEKYLHDKSALEAEIRMLKGVITNFEGELAKLSQENSQLESRAEELVQAICSFESRIEELEQAACSLEHSASEIGKLQEVIKNTKAELEEVSLEKEETIKNLEAQLERALQEKSKLQNQIKELEKVVCDSLEKHSLEKSYLSAELLKLSESNASLEGKLTSMEAELKQVYADKAEESVNSEKQISALNQDLANLTSKLELISSEKATADNKLATLLTDITTRDEKMKQMDDHLSQLHLEHAKIMAETGIVRASLSELRTRVSELEEEVENQKLSIFESAEGKREAIRQLCFSLEHYRSGYQQLRQLLQQGHRRPLALMAA